MARPGPFSKVIRAPGVEPKQFGNIPGVPIGATFADRVACSAKGVHAPLQAGIHGTVKDGAYSIVVSGGYADDVDAGSTITYTGSGGRTYYKDKMDQIQGKKSFEGRQNADQTWTRNNLALKRSKETGLPVRVTRGASLNSPYAPAEGYRYDGLYTVTEASMDLGKEGFKMCKFRFERLPDQPPLPAPSTAKVIKPSSKPASGKKGNSKREPETPLRIGPPVRARRSGATLLSSTVQTSPITRQLPIASSSKTKVEDLTVRPTRPVHSASGHKLHSSLMKKVSAGAKSMLHFKPENRLIKRSLPDAQPKNQTESCKRSVHAPAEKFRTGTGCGQQDMDEDSCRVAKRRKIHDDW